MSEVGKWGLRIAAALIIAAIVWVASSTMGNTTELAVQKERQAATQTAIEKVEAKVDDLNDKLDYLIRELL